MRGREEGQERRRTTRLVAAGGLALATAFAAGAVISGHTGSTPSGAVEITPPPPPSNDRSRLSSSARPRATQERTPRGAATTSLRLLSGFSDARLLTDPARRARFADGASVPAFRAHFRARLDESYDFMATDLGLGADPTSGVVRVVPVGYRVEAFTPDHARVAVWHVAMAGRADRQVIAGWTTSRFGLRWTDRGWKLETVYPDEVGPTPQTPEGISPTPAAQLVATAATFEAP